MLCYAMLCYAVQCVQVCEDYFVPAMGEICLRFGVSEDMAGATLLAVGSSAPQVRGRGVLLVGAIVVVGIGWYYCYYYWCWYWQVELLFPTK
jgi:hypothetical protein